MPRPRQRSGYQVLPGVLPIDRHCRQGPIVSVCAAPGDRHSPAGEERRKLITALFGKSIVAPPTATAFRAASHFRGFDVGDAYSFALAGSDSVAVMHVGDAGRGQGRRSWGIVQEGMGKPAQRSASNDYKGDRH